MGRFAFEAAEDRHRMTDLTLGKTRKARVTPVRIDTTRGSPRSRTSKRDMSASAAIHTGRITLGAPARVAVSSSPSPSPLLEPTIFRSIVIVDSLRPIVD